eukprot:CAMPEP_0176431652 /NCGR_PEP_ID=MMETSP0127-20121128/14928_1 /TAXON_ID=938130 /ORGANISM="Platyophrya macrostoma, Strain WH" /LENGTH=369 /DNA_ID=CAMNT_0017813677 /DNA_START=43 /DNA_END=1152 /DNA_ORIENTATION=-
MKRLLITVAICAAVVLGAHPKAHQLNGYTFEQYVRDFGKKYASAKEYEMRKVVFEKKLAVVQAHNAGSHSYKKGINHMSDWTHEEFLRTNGGRPRAMAHLADKSKQRAFVARDVPLPPSIDYRNRIPAVLTAVKDQGDCGSCWAHGSTEQMETYWALATNELYVASQQQVTACAPNPQQCGGTGGCLGSTAELAFEYVINSGGLTQEWEYPYTAYNGTTGQCLGTSDPRIKLTGYVKLNSNDQDAVMNALAFTGPLAINVDASSWSDYESGVFSGCNYANNITIDHVVQLVGYGTDDGLGLDYWVVRNSWSPIYGESGFIRVLRTATPACGWDVDAQQGYACADQPTQLWVCGECGILGDTSYPIVQSN